MSVTKSTLVATSHLIETLVYEHGERCALVSGFQHGRHWAVERDRYRGWPRTTTSSGSSPGRNRPRGWEPTMSGLRLRTGDPLGQEWLVLAVGPGLAITLCGLDGDAHVTHLAPVREADRLFDVVWSVDPQVAAVAAEVVIEAVARSAPAAAGAVEACLRQAAQRDQCGEASGDPGGRDSRHRADRGRRAAAGPAAGARRTAGARRAGLSCPTAQ